ncbi:SUMF1/EgtB/PvdO family nonheme iron enzyme [Alteromonas hispanica]|uniref:non-specific serine/threonine protein kinase n=1 Tax=Alteromonas hispanica TaxID=315421 RepID=A0A6L9MSV0_9ALTE|nr:SUMF1/EgtB/PvdO family nonheme iron enzyme [Alteromonas hispanica]NDW21196.1 SUMF1/EgtB/PvdO family nonheme iron enzyme [Alteromonas hispanica]
MQVGTQLGKYTIGRKLGAGGMADVYLATDSVMGRDIALKVLPPEFARDAERIHRFQKEVQASATLSHPNIIPVFDVGDAQVEGFTYHYYTMALLPGGDLKQRIEQGLTQEQSLTIIKAIADALGYAHNKGLVHRDIKPENVLFDESDRPILTDLGIAKAINSGTKMTGTGMSIGTPHYMSPEQAKGESDLDGRSDIYALGIMLFEMLTGQVPYQGDNTMAVGIMHIQNPLPELPQHLKDYQGLLDNCLAKDKASRYQHAQALITDIDKLLQGQAVRASQKTRVVQGANAQTQATANQGMKWGLGGALIATLLVVGVYFYQQNISPRAYSSPVSQQVQTSSVSQSRSQSSQPVAPQKNEAELAQARLAELAITRQLDELAKAAEADIAALRLTKPKGNNALEKISEMEHLKPKNALAAALTTRLSEKYRDLTLSTIKANQFDKAQDYIDALEAIKPGYSQSQGLSAELAQQKKRYEEAQVRLTAERKRQEKEAAIVVAVEKVKSAINAKKFIQANTALQMLKRLSPNYSQLNALTEQYARAKEAYESVERYIGKMVTIPAGTFMMGCTPRDSQCGSEEKPRHRVTVRSFKLMESEVTFAMWDVCVSAGGCKHIPQDEGWGRGDRPVINVSYDDVLKQFIPWLNRSTGQTFRLPSEAEWEYAARAGNDTQYGWGNGIGRNNANCKGCGSLWDNKQTAPVKRFSANQFGLYDLYGNVWEWTADCWNDSYKGAPSNGSAWILGACSRRVLRGGAWRNLPVYMRVSYRLWDRTDERRYDNGFRLAQDMQ